jgi:uncharacterized protein (DUF1015 family)
MADIHLSPGFATYRNGSATLRPSCARRTTSSTKDERRELEARHPDNVVRLELPRGTDDARYTTAARLLASWTAEGILRPDARERVLPVRATIWIRRPALHAARVLRGGPPRAARTACGAAARETLSAPKEDRKKLLRATHTQISPVFGLYRDAGGAARAIIDEVAAGAPTVDATTTDGVRHRLWVITAAPAVVGLRTLLADKQILIADGHHRYETMLGWRPSCGLSTRRPARRRRTS